MNQVPSVTRVTEKGQATIPFVIREYLGINQGDYVAYEIDRDGRVVVGKARIGVEPVDSEKTKTKRTRKKGG